MFKGLFKSARALARHRDAPLAEERARYIQHCMEQRLDASDHCQQVQGASLGSSAN